MKRKYLLIIIGLSSYTSVAQYLIKGHTSDTIGNKVAYLDIIDSWDGFNSISEQMILKKSEIDSNGNYYFKGNELADQLGYYRIRITEKNIPAVSIGQNSLIYFTMTNNDTISIDGLNKINDLNYNKDIFIISKKVDSLNDLVRSTSNDRIRNLLFERKEAFLNEKLILSNKPLVAMLSAHYKKDRDEDFIENIVGISKNLDNPKYRKIYKNSLDKFIGQENYKKLKHQNSIQFNLLVFSMFINLIIITFFSFYYFKRKKRLNALQWNELTNKELEVLELISIKKSNKEMADLLFVSESTIKSHVNNIYRKLGIQSRKEAIKLYYSNKSAWV